MGHKGDDEKTYYLEAPIQMVDETEDMKRVVASVIDLPIGEDKQPDLLYFTALFASSGANLNHAYFFPSELVAARNTIANKAVDIEHDEEEIVGHLYDWKFVDKNNEAIDVDSLLAQSDDEIDTLGMDIIVAGVVYKTRFKTLSKEVQENKWCVSLETFYEDYDIKVGDTCLKRQEAESLGLTLKELGKSVRIVKNNYEMCCGEVKKVLRNLLFSGCGFVKHPANTTSFVLETSNVNDEDPIIINIVDDTTSGKIEGSINADTDEDTSFKVQLPEHIVEKISNETEKSQVVNLKLKDGTLFENIGLEEMNCVVLPKDVATSEIEDIEFSEVSVQVENADIDTIDIRKNTSVGICVNYKRFVHNASGGIVHNDWCSLYATECASFSRDVTDPDCLKNVVRNKATAYINYLFDKYEENSRIAELMDELLNNLSIVSIFKV